MRLPREVALQLIGGFNVPHVDEIVVDASSGHQQRRVAFAVRHTEGMTNFVRTHQLANAAGELVSMKHRIPLFEPATIVLLL